MSQSTMDKNIKHHSFSLDIKMRESVYEKKILNKSESHVRVGPSLNFTTLPLILSLWEYLNMP